MSKTIRDIETSLTLDYRRSVWGIERIVLDSISNHLPADSNSTVTSVKLKQDGQYVDLKHAEASKPTEEVVFEDNGSGYDAGLLSVLFSPKAADALSIGQFGEGLKLVGAAALRHRLNLEYRSRNWIATPFAKPETIDNHRINRLCFRVTENGDYLDGSRTVFTNPSAEFLEEVFSLPGKVLALNNGYTELHNEKNNAGYDMIHLIKLSLPKYSSRIIDTGDGSTSLFVKGVRIQGIHSIFSYDLGLEEVTPDRMFANRDKVLYGIEALLKGCTNPQVIEAVLRKAEEKPDSGLDEFEAFKDRSKKVFGSPYEYEMEYTREVKGKGEALDKYFKKEENLWVTTFRKIHGENAVIASSDTTENTDATLMGYKPVRLNTSIENYLRVNGIETVDNITRGAEYRWVSLEDLTRSESERLATFSDITNFMFGQDVPVEIRVYSGLFTKSGREIKSAKGVHIQEESGRKYIGLKMELLLMDEIEFVNTCIHETGHHVSGIREHGRTFADFFTRMLAAKYLEQKKL